MEVFRSEIKVGLLILVAFVLLGAGIFIASDVKNLLEDKKSLELLFPYADGITKGSPVWYAGFEVGEVSDIRIAQEATDRIAVSVKIDPKARVRKDSRIEIRSLGMMGAKYVEITPGSPDAPELTPGETLEGRSPASLSEIMETGQQVAARLVALVDETQGLIHEIRTESSIKDVLQNGNALISDLRGQAKELKPVLDKANRFADSLDATGRNIEKLSGESGQQLTAFLKELRETNRGLQKRLDNLEVQLTKTLGQVDKGFTEAEGAVKGVRTVVSSSEQDLATLLKNLRETSRHLAALSEDLRAHPWKVVWKEDGTYDVVNPPGADQWREKERIGPHGRK